MAGGQRDRRRPSGQERRKAAAEAARRRKERTRWMLIAGGGAAAVLAVVLIVVLSSSGGGKKKSTAVAAGNTSTVPGAGSSTPTSGAPAATGSAAGKPCVARSDPLPPGAPEVPVEVGPPPTNLVTKDLKVGTGPTVPAGSTVTVNYIGVSCSTGKIFDSSYKTNTPATFSLTQVIPGWTNGIPGMNVGGQRLLGIPSSQAYGATGHPPDIAPDEPLWFVVEVTAVTPPSATPTSG